MRRWCAGAYTAAAPSRDARRLRPGSLSAALLVVADPAALVPDLRHVRRLRHWLRLSRPREVVADHGDLAFLHRLEELLTDRRSTLLFERLHVGPDELRMAAARGELLGHAAGAPAVPVRQLGHSALTPAPA